GFRGLLLGAGDRPTRGGGRFRGFRFQDTAGERGRCVRGGGARRLTMRRSCEDRREQQQADTPHLGRASRAFLASASFCAAACCSQLLALAVSAASPAPPLANRRPSLRCASATPARAARSYQSAARAPSGVKPPRVGWVSGS